MMKQLLALACASLLCWRVQAAEQVADVFAHGEGISLAQAIPANERGILCLAEDAKGRIYGGTTGRAAAPVRLRSAQQQSTQFGAARWRGRFRLRADPSSRRFAHRRHPGRSDRDCRPHRSESGRSSLSLHSEGRGTGQGGRSRRRGQGTSDLHARVYRHDQRDHRQHLAGRPSVHLRPGETQIHGSWCNRGLSHVRDAATRRGHQSRQRAEDPLSAAGVAGDHGGSLRRHHRRCRWLSVSL